MRLLRANQIQPKLSISHPDDQYEREADRVADHVMRMPDPQSHIAQQRAPLSIQRMCKSCEEESPGNSLALVQRKCTCDAAEGAPCECSNEDKTIQRKAISTAPQSTPQLVRGGGQALNPSTRDFMEQRFGFDFAGVRVHTGADAAASARSLNAQAYTIGHQVVFAAGQYQPHTESGRRLLAHELTHVIQQDHAQRIQRKAFPCTTGVLTDTRCTDAQGSGHPAGVNLEHFVEEKSKLNAGHFAQIKAFKIAWDAAGSKDDVKVHGYASCDGEPALNVQLSCARAEAVKAELVKQGITTTITTEAHGETDEFGANVDDNRRAIIESVKPTPPPKPPTPPTPPSPASCKAVPGATTATCVGRNGGYCSAESCFPTNPWLKCVCGTSLKICEAIDAFSFTSVQGKQLETCIDASVKPPANMGVKFVANQKADWFRDTNKCIWGHWKEALDALHDPSAPIPGTVTGPWKAAIAVCRSKGVASSDCCKAQVDAEQQAIDTCGKYDSSRFGSLPTDIPGAPVCSRAARFVAPSPPFTGDFGNVSDRIAYGNKVCCP